MNDYEAFASENTDNEYTYLQLLETVMRHGNDRGDRTGTGTRSKFGLIGRYDLSNSFPLLTTKKMHFKSILVELLWILRGDTNVRFLQENGCSIWNEWADKDGEIGPAYGKQLRAWECPDGRVVDQLLEVQESIRNNPESRRHLVSLWNVSDVPKMKLPCCHFAHQYYVEDGKLSCMMHQRSADMFLGVPFNIASYSLLTMMMAQVCGLGYGVFLHTIGDAHVYSNHMDQVRTQMSRLVLEPPTIKFNRVPSSITDFQLEDIELVGYQSHPAIKAEVAV